MRSRLLRACLSGIGVIALVACGCSSDSDPPDNALPEVECGEAGMILDIGASEQLAELAGCTTLLGSLRFGDTGFANVDGLEAIRRVDGGINLFRNPALVNLDGLRSLETVGGDLFIHHNPLLNDVTGLSALRAVDGELFIASNEAIETLGGLEQVRATGALSVLSNMRLRDLDGLSGLTFVRADLVIRDNSALPQANAEAFAADVDVGGAVEVSGNQP